MPTLVPAQPRFSAGGRAEKAVWTALRDQLPDEAVLFHGRRFEERRQEYEADLIVAYPGADWAVIEVTGGDVRPELGEWEQRQQGMWRRIEPLGVGSAVPGTAREAYH